jgi:hypothetical protein
MELSKEELFLRIRQDSWQQGLSVRALSRKYRVHRRLVREALASPVSRPRKTPVRSSPRLEPFKKTIDEWLVDDLRAPPKQRHTVQRILNRLQQECGAEITYTTVWDYVSKRRREIAEASGASPAAGFVIQHNRPGMDAEVDFGEAWVDLAGERTKCYVFAFRLAYSGKAVHASPLPADRRRSWTDMCTRFGCWAGSLPGRSATTTCLRRCPGDPQGPVAGAGGASPVGGFPAAPRLHPVLLRARLARGS